MPAAPDAASWTPEAQALLAGSDLGAALPALEVQLADFECRLRAILQDACPPIEVLRWARGMLLSRRFPALGPAGNEASSESTSGEYAWGARGTLGNRTAPILALSL